MSQERYRQLPTEGDTYMNRDEYFSYVFKDRQVRYGSKVTDQVRVLNIRGSFADAFDGVNDTERHLEALSSLLDPTHFRIILNLLNPISESELKPSSATKLLVFKQYLESSGFTTDIRLSKGTDIAGGCGQLAVNNPV